MKIYELIKELNKKATIKNTKVMSVKKYYMSMYRVYMLYLYDKGYISDPIVFDTKEIFSNIVDLGISDMSNSSGKIELSSDYIGYAMVKNKDNEEVYEFLELLYNAVKYRELSMNLDKFYDDCGFNLELKQKVSQNLYQSASRVLNKGGYDINEAILKCFDDGYDYEFVSLNEYVYEKALEELGITDGGDSSLFVSNLTREEEIEYSHLILNGLVKLDGEYSSKLVSWLKANKWSSENKFSSKNEGMYNWVMYIKSNDTIDEQARLLNELLDKGYTLGSMKSDGFYVKKDIDKVDFPIGVFAVVGDEDGDILPDINKLEGYTGEVYTLSYLVDNDISFVGCPIELYTANKTKDFFVDREQTELKDTHSWFSNIGATVDFSESNYVEGVFAKGSLEDDLYKLLGDSENGVLLGSISLSGKNLDSAKKLVAKKI